MIECQLTVRDRDNEVLFTTFGIGMTYGAARSAANIGMRARLSADRGLERRVRIIEAERI